MPGIEEERTFGEKPRDNAAEVALRVSMKHSHELFTRRFVGDEDDYAANMSDLNHARFALAGILSKGIGGPRDTRRAAQLLEEIAGTRNFIVPCGRDVDRVLDLMAQLERAKLSISMDEPLSVAQTETLLRAVFTSQGVLRQPEDPRLQIPLRLVWQNAKDEALKLYQS